MKKIEERSPLKPCLLLFLIPPALFLAGCLGSRSGRPVTPIQAAIEAVPRNAQQFRGYGIEKTPNGNVGVVFFIQIDYGGKTKMEGTCLGLCGSRAEKPV